MDNFIVMHITVMYITIKICIFAAKKTTMFKLIMLMPYGQFPLKKNNPP